MIVITTPTGDIGGQALALLLQDAPARGEELRVVVRDPARLPAAVRDAVDVVVGSHGDADVVDRAFAGADAVLWIVPPDRSAASLIAGTGVAYRALANPSFMDNLLRQVASIRERGVFTDTVAPDRRAPTAATRDIAAVAVELLLDRSWTGVGSVPVLGPEDLSQADLARIASEVLGTSVLYERQSLEALGEAMVGYGASEAFARGMIDMMRAKEEGLDDGVPRSADHSSPTTFRRWCEEVLKPAVLA